MRGGDGNLVASMEGTGWNGGTKKCVELVCYGVERYYMGGVALLRELPFRWA